MVVPDRLATGEVKQIRFSQVVKDIQDATPSQDISSWQKSQGKEDNTTRTLSERSWSHGYFLDILNSLENQKASGSSAGYNLELSTVTPQNFVNTIYMNLPQGFRSMSDLKSNAKKEDRKKHRKPLLARRGHSCVATPFGYVKLLRPLRHIYSWRQENFFSLQRCLISWFSWKAEFPFCQSKEKENN